MGVQYKVNSIKSIKYLDRVFKQYKWELGGWF